MKRTGFLDELRRRPLCVDGAMGTQLLRLGLASGESGMLWNVNRPADIRDIHSAYRQAGCELITTNSFGGSSHALAAHGLEHRTSELNCAAAQLARAAAGTGGWVLGDVGPFGGFLEPVGEMEADTLRGIFREQIAALLAGGADAILIETMSDPSEVAIAVEAAREESAEIPVIVTYAFQKTGSNEYRTMMGTDVAAAVRLAVEAGADVVGANCGTALTLSDYENLGRQLVAAAGGRPVVVQPNAGAPRVENGQTIHDAEPAQMASTAEQLLAAGVRLVGGCCGTTPAHLVEIAAQCRRFA